MKNKYGGSLIDFPKPIRMIILRLEAATKSNINYKNKLIKIGQDVEYKFRDIAKQIGCVFKYNKYKINRDIVCESEETFEQLHGFRTKSDRVIRRSRYIDIYTFVNKERDKYKYMDEIFMYFNNVQLQFDYITLCNIFIACIFFGYAWFRNWQAIGAFSTDILDMSAIMSKFSDRLKETGCNIPNWECYLECKNLTGYRNPPFGDFDMLDDSRALANSGIDHYWSEDVESYREMVNDMLFETPSVWPKRMSFREYIASGIWSRNGSSSLGKIEIIIEGEIIRFKARKNQLLYLYTVDEIVSRCMSTNAQINYSFIKPETGKLRIAVSSDVFTYLKMSYIYYCAGDFYLKWTGITSTESVNSECNRLLDTLNLISVNWGMPYDYASFDHQPMTRELIELDGVFHRVGRMNVDNIAEYDLISNNVRSGWHNAKLIVRDKEEIHEYDVTGGLMSGLFNTAVMNNAWNAVNAYMATSALGYVIRTGLIYINIKGDDSSFINRSSFILQLLEFTLVIMDLKGGIGKFGIVHHNTEFLRTWFKDRCYGYPCRNIPGIMQNKPWSENGDWTPYTNVKSVVEICTVISRRLRGSDTPLQLSEHIAERWCRSHKLPDKLFNIPKIHGGLGLLPWDGCSHIVPPIPEFKLPKINYKSELLLDDVANLIVKRSAEYKIQIDHEYSKSLARDKFESTLSSGDIPIMRKKFRDYYFNIILANKKFNVIKKHKIIVPDLNVHTLPLNRDSILNYSKNQKIDTTYAQLSHEVSIIDEFRPIIKQMGISIHEFAKINNFKIYGKLNNRDHISETLDWYGGRYTFPVTNINNKIIKLVHIDIVANYKTFLRRGGYIAGSCYRAMMLYVHKYFNMPLHYRLLLW